MNVELPGLALMSALCVYSGFSGSMAPDMLCARNTSGLNTTFESKKA